MNLKIVWILLLFGQRVISKDYPISKNRSLVYTVAGDACYKDGLLSCSLTCKGQNFCMYGKVITVDCSVQTGKPFCDPKTVQCTSSTTTCDVETLPDFICPEGGTFYPHALNCSKFWYCGNKNPAQILNCNKLVFDPKSKSCVSGIPCYTFSPVNGLCRGKTGAIVVHPLERRIFAHCSGNFPQIGECPENHVFNTNKLNCEFECKAVGNFKDPVDPNCYYSCSKYYASLVSERVCCEKDQIFYPELNTCGPKLPEKEE